MSDYITARLEAAEERARRIERKQDAIIHFLLASHGVDVCTSECRPCAALVRESVEANLR